MYYSQDHFNRDVESLTHQVIKSENFYDYVVGVARGGLIPAVCLSHQLGIPMRSVSWSTFHHDQMRETALDIAQDIADGKKILLVDDILDSGRTIIELMEDWQCDTSQVDIAVLIYNVAQSIIPKYWGTEIDKRTQTDWVDFWWENQNK